MSIGPSGMAALLLPRFSSALMRSHWETSAPRCVLHSGQQDCRILVYQSSAQLSLNLSLPPCPSFRSPQIAILRKIHHPNTTQFLGACTKQMPYIVITELMACSLADAFQRTIFTPPTRRKVSGLSGLHEDGIGHGPILKTTSRVVPTFMFLRWKLRWTLLVASRICTAGASPSCTVT